MRSSNYVDSWRCPRRRIIAAGFLAIQVIGCGSPSTDAPRNPQPLTTAQSPAVGTSALLAAIEQGADISDADKVLTLARKSGVPIPLTAGTWDVLLQESLRTGWRPRHALLLVAERERGSFLTRARDLYAGRTDPFTEGRLLQLFVDMAPEDPRTAEYALSLALRVKGASWPPNIDLHGLQPFDAVAGQTLPDLWLVPDEVLHSTDEAVWVRWIQAMIERRVAWRYDQHTKKWST